MIELIITLLVIGGAILASASIFRNQLQGNLESDSQIIANRLSDAQARALAVLENSAWGIHFDYVSTTPFYAVFPGTTYSVASDTFYLSGLVEFQTPASGASSNIVFAKRTGMLTATATVVIGLKNSTSNTKTITVSPQGFITIQ